MNLFPAEALTDQHRYLKARVVVQDGTVRIENTHGQVLEQVEVGAVEPVSQGGWWFWEGQSLRARETGGCGCGGTQVL